MIIVHTILFITASNGWCLYQMDVKNVFLHVDLTEDTYMTPPQGLFSSFKGVCKVKRSLYGNKRPGHGKRNFAPLYLSSPLPKVSMTPFYLFIAKVRVLFYFFCMLMIWLSLVLIILTFNNLNNSYKPHFI